jgi:type I restriction enzyme R subunit
MVFIKTIQTYFARRKHVEIKDLWGAPFTNLGTNVPEPMFGEKDLKDFIEICNSIERDLYEGEA